MSHICVKPEDRLTVDGDVIIRVDRVCGGCAHLTVDALDDVEVAHGQSPKSVEEIREDLQEIARTIVSEVFAVDAESSQELLGAFASDLFYAAAQKRQQIDRRQKQAEGIATAKAKGVRFGRTARALPEGFERMARLWESGSISARSAAEELGMSRDTFLRRAREYCTAARFEASQDGCAV